MPKIESTCVNFEEKTSVPNGNQYLIKTGTDDETCAAAMNLIFDNYSLKFFPFEEMSKDEKCTLKFLHFTQILARKF